MSNECNAYCRPDEELHCKVLHYWSYRNDAPEVVEGWFAGSANPHVRWERALEMPIPPLPDEWGAVPEGMRHFGYLAWRKTPTHPAEEHHYVDCWADPVPECARSRRRSRRR